MVLKAPGPQGPPGQPIGEQSFCMAKDENSQYMQYWCAGEAKRRAFAHFSGDRQIDKRLIAHTMISKCGEIEAEIGDCHVNPKLNELKCAPNPNYHADVLKSTRICKIQSIVQRLAALCDVSAACKLVLD